MIEGAWFHQKTTPGITNDCRPLTSERLAEQGWLGESGGLGMERIKKVFNGDSAKARMLPEGAL
jgi:hypothetical protein